MTATGSTTEGLEYGSVIAADVDICSDVLLVVVRIVVAESTHDATVDRVEFDEMSGTPIGSNLLTGERARAGAGRDDELRIGLCKREAYSSA